MAHQNRTCLRRKITLENPAKYFGLDLDKPITETPAA
jgi:hypothetical protein